MSGIADNGRSAILPRAVPPRAMLLGRGFLAVWFGAACLAAACLAAPAPADQAPQVLDEVVVTGERTGPGLWHVHRGNAQVWILGSLSPLPKGITWRSKQVEQILDGTHEVLIQKPLEIGIARIVWLFITERRLLMLSGGKRLKDVLPANLHARFAVQRAKYTDAADKWERFRPLVAAAFLQRAAFHRVGLSTRVDLGAAVRMLAEKHHVDVEEIKIAGVRDVVEALKTLPAAAENACVEASIATVESGLPRLVERAQAWADGNVERLESLPEPKELNACRAALDEGSGASDLIARIRRTWLDAIDARLRGGGVTLAVVNIDMLLERGGLLDELRAQGFQVDAP